MLEPKFVVYELKYANIYGTLWNVIKHLIMHLINGSAELLIYFASWKYLVFSILKQHFAGLQTNLANWHVLIRLDIWDVSPRFGYRYDEITTCIIWLYKHDYMTTWIKILLMGIKTNLTCRSKIFRVKSFKRCICKNNSERKSISFELEFPALYNQVKRNKDISIHETFY